MAKSAKKKSAKASKAKAKAKPAAKPAKRAAPKKASKKAAMPTTKKPVIAKADAVGWEITAVFEKHGVKCLPHVVSIDTEGRVIGGNG